MAILQKWRWFAAAGALLLVAVALFKPVGNAIGYCFVEHRFLTRDELISAVVNYVYQHHSPDDPAWIRRGVRKPVTYASKEDFLQINKDCCKIISKVPDTQPNWLHYASGRAALFVEAAYRFDRDPPPGDGLFDWDPPPGEGLSNTMPPGITKRYYIVTNCGRVW